MYMWYIYFILILHEVVMVLLISILSKRVCMIILKIYEEKRSYFTPVCRNLRSGIFSGWNLIDSDVWYIIVSYRILPHGYRTLRTEPVLSFFFFFFFKKKKKKKKYFYQYQYFTEYAKYMIIKLYLK